MAVDIRNEKEGIEEEERPAAPAKRVGNSYVSAGGGQRGQPETPRGSSFGWAPDPERSRPSSLRCGVDGRADAEDDRFATTDLIRARERGTGVHLPVIAMTAHATRATGNVASQAAWIATSQSLWNKD
jgi:hypothetical protein